MSNTKHPSKYELKLIRRRAAGAIHFSHPVDSQGQMTLNPAHIAGTRSFSRLRRSEEV